MRAVISLLFGSQTNSKGWISEEYIPSLPPVGLPVLINLEAEETFSVEGQVYRTWEDSETSSGGMFIYAGSRVPDIHFQTTIENAGWQPITEDALRVLTEAVENMPIIAATHDILLVAGAPEEPINSMVAFKKAINPHDPTLPLFGQRLRLNIEDRQQDNMHQPVTAVLPENWERIRQQELSRIELELTSLKPTVTENNELPALTVYSARGRILGEAKVVLWTPHLAGLEPVSFIAQGWEQVAIPDRFSPIDFQLPQRIELALRTTLCLTFNDYGTVDVAEWHLLDPETVSEEQYLLLPPILMEKVKTDKEFLSIENILEDWSKNL